MICDCFPIVIYTYWPCALSSPRLDKFAHYKSPLFIHYYYCYCFCYCYCYCHCCCFYYYYYHHYHYYYFCHYPYKGPVIFLNKPLNKRLSCRWFEPTLMWRHCSIHLFCSTTFQSWWRHQMETFSALLAIRAGNSPVTGEFYAFGPVTQSFDVFFDPHLNKRLSKHWWGWSVNCVYSRSYDIHLS